MHQTHAVTQHLGCHGNAFLAAVIDPVGHGAEDIQLRGHVQTVVGKQQHQPLGMEPQKVFGFADFEKVFQDVVVDGISDLEHGIVIGQHVVEDGVFGVVAKQELFASFSHRQHVKQLRKFKQRSYVFVLDLPLRVDVENVEEKDDGVDVVFMQVHIDDLLVRELFEVVEYSVRIGRQHHFVSLHHAVAALKDHVTHLLLEPQHADVVSDHETALLVHDTLHGLAHLRLRTRLVDMFGGFGADEKLTTGLFSGFLVGARSSGGHEISAGSRMSWFRN